MRIYTQIYAVRLWDGSANLSVVPRYYQRSSASISMAKVTQEREKCIGCGSCAAVCPRYWEMAEDGKSRLKGSSEKEGKFELEVAEVGCNKEAADACPVQIIKVMV